MEHDLFRKPLHTPDQVRGRLFRDHALHVVSWALTAKEAPMITAIVQFTLPQPISLAEAVQRFESSAPKYQNLKGLVRKYYLRAEDGRTAGGVYLWESRAAAEAVYNGEWKARVEQ